MLELIARLLVALAVALGAHGVGSAMQHATQDARGNAGAALESVIADATQRASDDATTTAATPDAGAPDATGIDRALEVADDHAADGLATAIAAKAAGQATAAAARADGQATAAAAKAAGQAKAAAARSAHQPSSGTTVNRPPVTVPVTQGPPATHPPFTAPPVDAPGLGNRP
jgi:hypothetical protein